MLPTAQVVITTDASRTGWGATSGDVSFGGGGTGQEKKAISTSTSWSLPRSERFCLQFGTPAYQASNGQLNSYSLYQQEGRYSLQNAFRFIFLNLVLVFEEEVINICRAHPRGIEWFSRFIIQKAPRFQRLDVESSGFRDSFEEVGSTRCRSVCSPPQYSAEIILQLSSRPIGSGLRCIGSELGGSELFCLSSLCSPGVCPAENKTGEGQEGHSDCSELDSTGLVSSLATVVGRQSSHFTSECGSPQESPRRASSSDTPGLSQSNCLESLRSRGEFKDISTDAFNLICSAWRRGTEESYSVAWRKWCSWCQVKNINPLSASISDVIEFITSGFQSGLQYSTLNSLRSALSATLPSCEGVPVGQHPLIARLLQGIFNERPPLPKYSFTWDVNVIITFIQKNRSLSADLPLMQLSQKLVMLFALATAARSSDLHLLDLKFRSYSQEGVSFQLAGLSKTRRSGPPKSLFIKRLHSDPTLCPVTTLEVYEKATSQFRPKREESPDPLLLSVNRPHKPVASSTIGRWIKSIMKEAGVDTEKFQTHSTRAASTSAARSGGVPVDDILKCAGWSRRSTFERFYYKPINPPHLGIICSGELNYSLNNT